MKKAWRVLPVTRPTSLGSGICPFDQERATHRNPRRFVLYVPTTIYTYTLLYNKELDDVQY